MVKKHFGNAKFDRDYFSGKMPAGYPGGYSKKNLREHDYDYTDFASAAKLISGLGVKSYFEIGCACGYQMEELIKLGIKVKGWDISKYIVEKASPKVRPFIEIKNIERIIELPDKLFDIVHVGTVLGYEPLEKLDFYLKQIKRVAKKYAILYAGTPEDAPEENSIRKINQPQEWWDKKFSEYFKEKDLENYLWEVK